ncbi:MAG: hypothetical protein CYPHOPRED_002061 [Cyphobasidiales sp. Tagirdzhanova-0007]|nr:MAG: hypothetical protein CYPHOPRED_002061 [Cyphobasidiales sp. Tagirdzhanova-0007]
MASAKTDADAAMAAEDDSSLVSSLHTRLVSSGEWNKLLKHVRITLDGSQWEDDLREYTRDKVAESQATIPLHDLILTIQPQAQATIPSYLRDDLLAKIRTFVEHNVEE